jgi:hypothetical protein
MLGGVPDTTAWHGLRLHMEEQLPAMEGSCKCTEYMTRGGPSAWGLAVELTTLHHKK